MSLGLIGVLRLKNNVEFLKLKFFYVLFLKTGTLHQYWDRQVSKKK